MLLIKKITLGLLIAAALTSCASSRAVTRVAADEAIDLSGRWNDTDSSAVAAAMVSDSLKRVWLTDFTAANNRKPVVIVGNVRNRSSEHIDSSTFTDDIERELINSGKVSFVASEAERESVRKERLNQQTESDPETIKQLGKETGADFMMQGSITSQTDAIEGKKVVSYKVALELVNMETNEKVWIGSKQIKKVIEQSKYGL